MDNKDIIDRLWASDLLDPRVMDGLFSMAYNTSDTALAVRTYEQCQRNMAQLRDKPQLALKHYDIFEKAIKYAAETHFHSFLIWNELDRPPAERFYQPRMKQLRPIVDVLQRAADGELDEVFLSQPPRTGKTTIVQVFLVWYAKRFPEKANLYVSFAQGVVDTFLDGCTEFLTDPTYRLHSLFQKADLVYTNKQNGLLDLGRHKRYKSITARSLYGQLNGSCDCNGLLIGDDLLSGIEEALNPETLNKANIRVSNNVISRCKQGTVKIWIGTRWHPNDPIGKRLSIIEDSPEYKNLRYEVINIPALDENDESNFDYDYGVGFSTDTYHKLRAQFEAGDDIASWSAQYMGEPYFREGLLFPEEILHRYYELPDTPPDSIIAVADTKTTGKDYAVMPIAYIYGKDVFIEDFVCNNGTPDIVNDIMVQKLMDHNVQSCRFESNSAGVRIATEVHDMLKERGAHTHITRKQSLTNKVTKILACSGVIKERFYFKDRSQIVAGSEYYKAMKFLTTFTLDIKNKNDDVPDALSMLVEYIDALIGVKVEVIKPLF